MAFEHVEAREGVVDLRPRIHLAKPGSVLSALHSGHHRILPGAGLAQLVLKLGDVRLAGAKRVVQHLDLAVELIGHVGRLLLFEQSLLGEILAALGKGELGTLDPAVLEPVELGNLAPHLLLVGDRARGGGADLDEGFLHLHDDHPDHLGGVLGLVEEIGDVGGNDIARPRKDAHGDELLV